MDKELEGDQAIRAEKPRNQRQQSRANRWEDYYVVKKRMLYVANDF